MNRLASTVKPARTMAYTGLELAVSGGAIFLMENITPRLIVSTIMVLGGIALTIAGHASLSEKNRKGLHHKGTKKI